MAHSCTGSEGLWEHKLNSDLAGVPQPSILISSPSPHTIWLPEVQSERAPETAFSGLSSLTQTGQRIWVWKHTRAGWAFQRLQQMRGVTHKEHTLDGSVCVNRPKKANSLTIGRLVAAYSCCQEGRQCAQVPVPLSQGSGDSCTVISIYIKPRRLCTENSEFFVL